MAQPLDATGLDQLFRSARSRNAWKPETLPESTWRELYELARDGPTAANTGPARFVFVATVSAKQRLAPHLSEANRAKSLAAPAIAIIGYDLDFALHVPKLFPHNPGAQSWFSDPEANQVSAFRNSSLQAAYLMLAARALGLDIGPMSGFDHAGVDREFFAGTNIRSNLLCALGHGVDEPFPRLPRLTFEDACQVV